MSISNYIHNDSEAKSESKSLCFLQSSRTHIILFLFFFLAPATGWTWYKAKTTEPIQEILFMYRVEWGKIHTGNVLLKEIEKLSHLALARNNSNN